MPTLIDFDLTPRTALARGFVKGLAAPALLFSTHAIGAVAAVPQVSAPQRPHGDSGSLSGDWARIGFDLTRAIEKHGSRPQPTPDDSQGNR